MQLDEKQPCHWLLVTTNQMHQLDGFIFFPEWHCITVIGMKILWIHCTLYHFRLVAFLWFLSNLLIHSSLVHLIQNALKKIHWAIMKNILKVWIRSVSLSIFRDWSLFSPSVRIPTVKLKIPGKKHAKIRIPNFCYIQVIVFDLSYLPVAAVGT